MKINKIDDQINSGNVTAIVVTYEPDRKGLFDLLNALTPQVAKVILIDNASVVSVPVQWHLDKNYSNLEFHQQVTNVGLAAAQNKGLAIALATNTSHVLLCDQDSVPEPKMVERLFEGYIFASSQIGGQPVAAIGPATVDNRTGRISTFIVDDARSEKNSYNILQNKIFPIIDASFLISSGMLVSVEVFKLIGGLRSNYFIDHVDTEWCFRARAAGFRLVGLNLPLLRHNLGDEIQKVWFFRERHVSTHAPLRDYYMARNTLAMIKGGDLSLRWCLHFLWRIVQFLGFYILVSSQKKAHLKMLFLGVMHGIKGISGKLKTNTLQVEPIDRTPLDPND